MKTTAFLTTATSIVMAGIFSVATTTVTAQPLTPNEIFSAIDGEHDHIADAISRSDAQRVNFDIVGQNSGLLDSVLSGVDGEYDASSSGTRVNYLMPSHQSGSLVDEVLSAVDGEYDS